MAGRPRPPRLRFASRGSSVRVRSSPPPLNRRFVAGCFGDWAGVPSFVPVPCPVLNCCELSDARAGPTTKTGSSPKPAKPKPSSPPTRRRRPKPEQSWTHSALRHRSGGICRADPSEPAGEPASARSNWVLIPPRPGPGRHPPTLRLAEQAPRRGLRPDRARTCRLAATRRPPPPASRQ